MGLRIIAVGKVKERWIRDGIQEYRKRLRNLAIAEVKDSTLEKETAKILAALKPNEKLVLLTEDGDQFTSVELAHFLEAHQSENLVLAIGGPAGISNELRDRAWKTLSLSPLTFTHEMARLFLVEQLYRAHNILSGGNYHK